MKKLLLFVCILLLFGCATTGFYLSEIPTLEHGDIEIAIPNGVEDFTKRYYYSTQISEKLCLVAFLNKKGFHKLIGLCGGERTILALIEFKDDKFSCWVYIAGFPIPASKEKIEDLIKEYGNTIPSSYEGMVQGT